MLSHVRAIAPFLLACMIPAAAALLAFFVVIPALVRSGWGRWHVLFPPIEPAPDAVSKTFQSFSVGLINLGFGVHVGADARFLHLRPSVLACPFGLRPVSIPWEAVEVRGRFPFGRRIARIAGVGVVGPAWCLDLASPAARR